jgi:hypothetical protein
MEAKDWLTLLTSWIAIAVAGYSLHLHWRRDKREHSATQPLLDLNVSCPRMPDYSIGNFFIENRKEDKLIVEELRITKPREARFIEDLPTRPWKLLTSIPINVTLSKGQSHSQHFFIHPKKAAGDKFLFYAVVRTLGHREHVYRFKIERLATASAVAAA